MRKKSSAIIICVLLLFLIASCNGRKFDVYVESPLDFYTPTISSVPGFPLRVILPDEAYYGEYVFKWTTDKGKFLDWEVDGRISPLGRQAILNNNEIFWSPLEASEDMAEKASLEILVIRIDGGTVDSRLKFSIKRQDNGMYVLDSGR
ncbi:MAG: hypothetical protein JXN10_01395 [Clostridia bacterium]|nr:hypothetical protein [Clostridia bacterium]MBN2882156.1 hypothetical protein [Clostridia bacterium]